MGESRALSTSPGQVIGYRADGRPIHTIAGGAEGDPAGGDGQAGGEGGQGEPQGGQGDPQGGDPGGQGGQGEPQGGGEGGDTRYTEADMKKLRDEAAGRRTELRTAQQELDQHKQLLQNIAKQLDPNGGNGEDDPAKVAEQAVADRDKKDQELRALHIERAAEKAARKVGADPDSLVDSRAFTDSAKELDPEAGDFNDKMESLIKSKMDNNPRLRAGQEPARSGSEFTGGSGGGAPSNQPPSGDTDAWLKFLRGNK